jgi:anaphase-promoting complex subunit 8
LELLESNGATGQLGGHGEYDIGTPCSVSDVRQFIELKENLPSSPMLTFFAITVMLDLHTATDLVMNMIHELLDIFPTSVHLKAQRALVYYHMRGGLAVRYPASLTLSILDFETAEKEFDIVQKADPYRMEDVDIYSNMLYVMDKRAKLGKLAHEYAEIDRNRAEVCCLIGESCVQSISRAGLMGLGNYYSSRADHTKAITYFKRSLMLNREYLPAWTLMGHEFVELKNSHAAIEAYRKAIGEYRIVLIELTNARCQREGLQSLVWSRSSVRASGHADVCYRVLQPSDVTKVSPSSTSLVSAYTLLRPYDCRMWTALATVYEGLHRYASSVVSWKCSANDVFRLPDAIKSHTRALLGADKHQTPTILSKLATLHTSLSKTEEAIEYHRKVLALGERDGMMGVTEMAGSYLAVAEYEVNLSERKDPRADLALAAQYLEKVSGTNLPQRDKAETLLRDLRLKEARQAAGI